MWFAEDVGGILEDKLQKGRTGQFIKKIREAGSTDHRHESGRPKHARSEENVTTVNKLVGMLSQHGQTQLRLSTRHISRKSVIQKV